MTRQEYMKFNGETTDTFLLHRAYYAQFVTPEIIKLVVSSIGEDRIKSSTDKHMNDIQLRHWDDLHAWIPMVIREKSKELGEGNSLSTTVCVAKEAARQFQDAFKANFAS